MRKICLAFLWISLLGLPVWGGVVTVDALSPYTIGGNAVDNWPAVGDGSVPTLDAYAVAWFQSFAITGSVSVNVQTSSFDAGGVFNAYLTSGIGYGVTAAGNEYYSTTFTLPDPSTGGTVDPEWIRLFDGVYLGPGYYYLTIGAMNANTSAAWSTTPEPAVNVAPGFSLGDGSAVQFWASGAYPYSSTYVDTTYLPASIFSPQLTFAEGGTDPNLMFDVSTPEPGTIWLLGGALSLALLRRKRSA